MNSNSCQIKTALNKELSSFQFLLVIMMWLVLASCGDSSGPTYSSNINNNDNDSPGPNEVWMVGQSFDPSELRVDVGTMVTWINKSEMVHTVISGTTENQDGMFDSGDIDPDGTFTYTFNNTGTYDFFCLHHQPSMTGRIIVSESNDGY